VPVNILPIKPSDEECTYEIDKTFTKPAIDVLQLPDAATPSERGTYFPQSPVWRSCQDPRWSRGWVYCANYVLDDLRMDENRMAAIVMPPNAEPTRCPDGQYVSSPIPGMVKMVPGVPFIYFLNGDASCPYTLSCVHTLASLHAYKDYSEILDASVRLAKLTWGCESNVPPIGPLGHLEGLKRNDRSKSIASNPPPGSHDGSYSLATMVLKGTGQGTVIPAVQANTEEGGPQIAAVLKTLNELHKWIMPKCISRFEYEVAKFHSEDMNVVGFGRLEPNGTGCQFNLSSLCTHLSKRLGRMGSWHPNSKDDHTRYTLFVLLLKIGPSKLCFISYFELNLMPTIIQRVILALFAFPEAVFMSVSRMHGLSLLSSKAMTYTAVSHPGKILFCIRNGLTVSRNLPSISKEMKCMGVLSFTTVPLLPSVLRP